MPHELSKREKKIAWQIIQKGVQAEYAAALQTAETIITEWKNGALPNREAYHELYRTIQEHDKLISKRYDRVSGSHYLMTVAAIYFDKQITEEDLKDFSTQTKQEIETFIRFWGD